MCPHDADGMIAAPAEPDARTRSLSTIPSKPGPRILIVDDDPVVSFAFARQSGG